MKRAARASWIVLLLIPGLLLTGCVYLRLLKVKNQLKDFEANFALSGRPSLTIELRNPVLLARDARFLIGADPLSVSTGPEGDVNYYEFEMARSSAPEGVALEALSLNLHMKGPLLWKIEVPEPFLLYFSRNVVVETFRGAADAEVFRLTKTARVRLKLSPSVDAELPSRERTLLLLGTPLESRREGTLETLTYRYRIRGDARGVPIIARLTFSSEGLMRRAVVTWDSSTVDAEFLRE